MDDDNTIIEINNDSEDTLYDNDKIIKEVESKEHPSEQIIIQKKKKEFKISKKTIIIIIAVIAVIILVCIAVLVIKKLGKKQKPKPKENITERVTLQKDNYIYDDGTLTFKDEDNKDIGTYECTTKDDKKCYVSYLSNEDINDMPKYVDEKGNQIDLRSPIYHSRYVFVNDNNIINLYDIKEEKILNKYTLIKTNEYESLSLQQSDSEVVYKDKNGSYLIDITGKKLTNQIKGTIKNFNLLYIAVYNTTYSLYDYKGTNILSDYDFITFYEDYIITINNGKLYIYDQDLSKINEEGLSIGVSSYDTNYVIGKDKNLLEVKKPFIAETGAGYIRISDKKGIVDKTFNTYETALNKKYDYVNYIDGKIYIYSNKEKTELLSTYTCDNKNKITSSEDSYDNCFIAKPSSIINSYEDNSITPIIGEKYLLINDTIDTKKPRINIYDFTINSLATNVATNYQKVDVPASDTNITKVNTLSNEIICQNAQGYYGVINLDSTGLKSIIRFSDNENGGNTKSIKKLNDYYIAARDKNYLYKKTGGDALASSEYEIVDYQYNKLIAKNKYYIIYNENKSLSKDFIYVSLQENYFVGIDKNNNLNIYNYTDTKVKGLIEDLKIEKTDDLENSYTIETTKDENGLIKTYIIKIKKATSGTTNYKYNSDWSKEE